MATVTYTNNAGMTIADGATTVESVIVSGLLGTIVNIEIAIYGLSHTFPDDLDFMIAQPDGDFGFVFWSDACAGVSINDMTITITDTATSFLPDVSAISAGNYRPTNHLGNPDNFTGFVGTLKSPGDNGAETFASVFGGANPNGEWKLYASDDASFDTGSFTSWSLAITTNILPDTDLNGLNIGGTDTSASFIERTPVLIAPDAVVIDPDPDLTAMTVTLAARPDGDTVEKLGLNAAATTVALNAGLTVAYDASTGELSVTGDASPADYQAILKGIQYSNTSPEPATSLRTVTVVVEDSEGAGDTRTVTIDVTAVNDAPAVTTSGGTTAFTEPDGPNNAPVVIDSGLTVSDIDSATLSSATVSIAVNYQTAEDVLSFVNDGATMGNVSASFNAATGVMTLTSAGATATLAQWQAALRSVTYNNSSDSPNTGMRTIEFSVNDGSDSSTYVTKTITVTAANHAPTLTGLPANIAITEDTSSPLDISSSSFADLDGDSITVTLSVSAGTISLVANGGISVALAGQGTSTVTISGLAANVNLYLDQPTNVLYNPPTNLNGASTATLTVSANDGSGDVALGTVPINISAVNDAPIITAPATLVVTEDIASALTGISFADVDAGSAAVTATFALQSGSLAAISGGGVTVGGTAQALTLTGSLVDINAFIAASSLTFTTAQDATADVVLSIKIDDGGNTGSGGALDDLATAAIQVVAANDAPVVSGPVTLTASDEDAPRTITTAELTALASDVDGGILSVANLSVSAGTLLDKLDGTWTYTPVPDDDTGVVFTYDVIDGNGGSISTSATLDLLPVYDASPNSAPSFTSPTQLSIGENQFLVAQLAATDPDRDTLSYTITGGDDAALFAINGKTGDLSFIQAPDFEAPDSATDNNEYQVRVEVSDGSLSTQKLFHVSVSNSNDEKVGTPGNDVFRATDAFAHFLGGDGRDTVVFKGSHEDYTITVLPDGRVTVGHGNGIDTLDSIERLQFDDGTLAFDADGNAGQMFRLYRAVFGREPDAEGLGYWVHHQDTGQSSFQDVARSFMASPEYEQRYGSEDSLSNSDFMDLLYQNVLGRDPDAEGFSYWLDKLDTGQTNFGDLLAFFSDSNENVAGTADAVSDGIWFV